MTNERFKLTNLNFYLVFKVGIAQWKSIKLWLWWLQVQVLLSTLIKIQNNIIWLKFYLKKDLNFLPVTNDLHLFKKYKLDDFIQFDLIDTINNKLLENFLIYYAIKKEKISINENKNWYIYIYFCLYSYALTYSRIENQLNMDYKILLINNKKNQLFTSILKNNKLFKSLSTGYILNYLDITKKSLKRQTSSYLIQLKALIKIIDNFFNNDVFLINILGTKKNFFKWLNFLKIKSKSLKVLIYLYTPSIYQYPLKVKKIKSIKKRLKKKYIYKENLI